MTIEERIEKLEQELAELKALSWSESLSDAEKEDCAVAADKIAGAFIWQDTPDGDDFWRQVCDTLAEMSRTGHIYEKSVLEEAEKSIRQNHGVVE